MDKLTAIKIKYDDGTYSDEIPVSVLSENVEWDNTHTLVDVLGSIDVDVTGTIQDQISQLFNKKVGIVEMQTYVSNSMSTYISTWLQNNVIIPTGGVVTIDKTLSIENAAADAKITGEQIIKTIETTDESLHTELNKIRDLETSNNLCDPEKLTIGRVTADGSIDTRNINYRTTDFIKITLDTSYAMRAFSGTENPITNRCGYLYYDIFKNPIAETYVNNSNVAGIIANTTLIKAKYIRFFANALNLNNIVVIQSNVIPTTYTPYFLHCINTMEIPQLNEMNQSLNSINENLNAIENITPSINLLDPSLIEDGFIYSSYKGTGNYSISGFIEIEENTYYTFNNTEVQYLDKNRQARFVSFFDKNKIYITHLENQQQFLSPNNAAYMVLTFKLNARQVVLFKGQQYDFTTQRGVYIPFGNTYSISYNKLIGNSSIGKNLFNIETAIKNSFLYVYPAITSNNMYFVSDYIPIVENKKYFIPYSRSYVVYDLNKQKYTGSSETQQNWVLTAPITGFLRVSGRMDGINRYQIEEGEEATLYEDYKEVFSKDYPLLNNEQIQQTGNILYKKKWAVCGDSFTMGSSEQSLITKGLYRGLRHVYPYIIGNRNNMEIVRFFEGGRTLAFPENPGTFTNSLTNPNADFYYQNIPNDVDYITIYLGINDEHHSSSESGGDGEDNTGIIPIGTINDNTTATYLGAYNVVLTWLIINRPNAHIGIIVTNGNQSKDEYRQGQIAIATKYGIPYIDLNGDTRTPAMLRTSNPNIPSSIKTALINKWAVNVSTNTHPNDAAHEFESTFIENFLRSI